MEIFKWMEWVIVRNHALSEVDDSLTRPLAGIKAVSSNTFLRYMRHVVAKVGECISRDMTGAFGLTFDGWSCGTLHFVAIYGVFAQDGVLRQVLLAVSPAEFGQSTVAHIEMVDAVLELYKKDSAMLPFLIADHCATNLAIANRLDVSLIGCASHRFNLIDDGLKRLKGPANNQVQTLVVQLRYPNNAAELARHTHLKPLKANATRWTSTFTILERYVKIRDPIKLVAAVEDLLPRPSTHLKIFQLVEKLEELDSMCINLQAEDRSLADLHHLFDAVVSKYPATAEFLKPSAKIVHSPIFESAVVKLQSDQVLTTAEEESVARFVVPASAGPASSGHVDFAIAALRQAKRPRYSPSTKYQYILLMTPPTSNRCEHMFSQCKLVLAPLRSSLLPANFETIMLLRANRDLWDFTSLLGFDSTIAKQA